MLINSCFLVCIKSCLGVFNIILLGQKTCKCLAENILKQVQFRVNVGFKHSYKVNIKCPLCSSDHPGPHAPTL